MRLSRDLTSAPFYIVLLSRPPARDSDEISSGIEISRDSKGSCSWDRDLTRLQGIRPPPDRAHSDFGFDAISISLAPLAIVQFRSRREAAVPSTVIIEQLELRQHHHLVLLLLRSSAV